MRTYLLLLLLAIAYSNSLSQTFPQDTLKRSTLDSLDRPVVGTYHLDEATFNSIPNINRAYEDFNKLVPSFSQGSFLGYNPYFNRYTLNGLAINNFFGFDGIQNGGQINTQTGSVTMLESINISTNTIDMSKSFFTGGLIELETKRGLNQIQGSAYSYYSGSALSGKKVNGELYDFNGHQLYQGGFGFGGAILKDELFYYVSFENEFKEVPGSSFSPQRGNVREPNESRVFADDLAFVRNFLNTQFGYETGRFEDFSRKSTNNKGLIRLDWKPSPEDEVSITYSFLSGEAEHNASSNKLLNRGPNNISLQFENSGYTANLNYHGAIARWKKTLSEKFTNTLEVGYSSSLDTRDPMSTPFPAINIRQNGPLYIVAGHDPFSANYNVRQNHFQAQNKILAKFESHSLTLGVSYEMESYDASLNFSAYEDVSLNYPGGTFGLGFISMNEFFQYVSFGLLDPVVDAAQQAFDENNANGRWNKAKNSFGQLSFFIQDDFKFNSKLHFSLGLRIEKPMYLNTADQVSAAIDRKGGVLNPSANQLDGTYAPQLDYFDPEGNQVQIDQTSLPKTPLLFSPRVGVLYKPEGKNKMEFSFNSGIYTGRVLGAWLNSQVNNTDYFNYMALGQNFRIPQVWRSGLSGIAELGRSRLRTEVIYSSDINAPVVRNYGLNLPSASLAGADSRFYYQQSDKSLSPFDVPNQNAYVLESESKGESFNASLSVETVWFKDLTTTFIYNYLDAKNVSSMESGLLSDAYTRNAIVDNSNTSVLAPSRFGSQHRLITLIQKPFEIGKLNFKAGIFNSVARGGRYSYVYAGDANGDGTFNNDLLYIPTGAELENYAFVGSVPIAEAQRAAFNNFINQDPYLSSRRGEYVERNGLRLPWQWQLDFNLSQTYKWNDQSLELTFDLINLQSLINSRWRPNKLPISTEPVAIGVDASTREPIYLFDINQRSSYIDALDFTARWQLRIGLNYSF